MAQKASTFDTRRATGMKPMMSNTRTCHQASPLQTLGADPVLPGLHRAMALIDIVATTWLVLMLPTSRLRPPHLCKQQARCVSKEPPPPQCATAQHCMVRCGMHNCTQQLQHPDCNITALAWMHKSPPAALLQQPTCHGPVTFNITIRMQHYHHFAWC